ncbi:MAG: RNA-binding protein [Verrucomicrobiae bacterium]|nr:RNA-binding protein [Verrucomicrobiae bacterium]
MSANHNGRGRHRRPRQENGARNPKPQASSQNPIAKLVSSILGLFKSSEPMVPIESSRLYIGNLSYKTVDSDLMGLFSKAGRVKTAEVIYDRNMNRSKGFAFIEMETLEDARKAARSFHNKDFMGRKLIVSGAKSEGERKPSRSRSRNEEESPMDEQESHGQNA